MVGWVLSTYKSRYKKEDKTKKKTQQYIQLNTEIKKKIQQLDPSGLDTASCPNPLIYR